MGQGRREERGDDEAEKGPRGEKEGRRGVCGERRKKRARDGQCLIVKQALQSLTPRGSEKKRPDTQTEEIMNMPVHIS